MVKQTSQKKLNKHSEESYSPKEFNETMKRCILEASLEGQGQ